MTFGIGFVCSDSRYVSTLATAIMHSGILFPLRRTLASTLFFRGEKRCI